MAEAEALKARLNIISQNVEKVENSFICIAKVEKVKYVEQIEKVEKVEKIEKQG